MPLVRFPPGESKGIKGGKRQKFVAAPDRDTHRSEFLSAYQSMTDEELMADGIARNNRIERLEGVENRTNKQQQLLNMMIVENDIAREELRSRKAGKRPLRKKPTPVLLVRADTRSPTRRTISNGKKRLSTRPKRLIKLPQLNKLSARLMPKKSRRVCKVPRARARRNAEEARQKRQSSTKRRLWNPTSSAQNSPQVATRLRRWCSLSARPIAPE